MTDRADPTDIAVAALRETARRLRAAADETEAEADRLAGAAPTAEITTAEETIEVFKAALRFREPEDTIRSWLRRYPDLGVKRGGRWEVYPSRLAAFLKRQQA